MDTREWFRDINGRIHTIVKNPNNSYCYFLTAWQRLLCSKTLAEYMLKIQCEKKKEMVNMILYSLWLYADINEQNIQEKIRLFTEFTESDIFDAHEGNNPNSLLQYYFLPVIYVKVINKDNALMLKILDEVGIYTSALSFSLTAFEMTKPPIFSFASSDEMKSFEKDYYNIFYNEFLTKNKENIRCEKFVSACLEIWQGANKTGFGHVVPLILDENKQFVIIDDIRTCEYLKDFVSRKSLNWAEMYIDFIPKDLLERYNIAQNISNNSFETTLCNCKIVRKQHSFSMNGGNKNVGMSGGKNKLCFHILLACLVIAVVILISLLTYNICKQAKYKQEQPENN